MREHLPFLLIILIAVVAFHIFFIATGGPKQVAEVQAFRKQFVIDCVKANGQVIDMSHSNISKMCVGPDGRILKSY